MGVYIKGMEMPTTCSDCPLSTFMDFDSMPFCNVTMDNICFNDWETKRCDNCPLVPVPPHGRLIDADALKAKQQEDADLFINAYTLMEKTRRDEALNAVANIVNAPTIIEAEEGE